MPASEMGINKEGIDIILAMRQLLPLQTELQLQTARARQLGQFLHGGSQVLEG